MVFERWRRQGKNTRDTLLLLANRLESASYEEDTLETLQQLYPHASAHPEDVLELCFDAVLKSIEKTEDKASQGMILQTLYTSSYGGSVLRQLVSKEEYAEILLSSGVSFLAKVIRTVNSDKLFAFLSKNAKTTAVLMNLLRSEYFMEFSQFIRQNTPLKEMLVFEGALEEIVAIYTSEKRKAEGKRPASKQCLISILEGSPKNQQYFFETDLFQQIVSEFTEDDLDVVQVLLDPQSKNYPIYQKRLMLPHIVTKAIECKAYNVIYNFINFNEDNFRILVEGYLDLNTLLVDCERTVDAFKLVEILARYTYFQISSSSSLRINTLLCILGSQFADLTELVIDDIKNKKLSMEHLIYLVFTRSTIEDLKQYLNYSEYDEPLSSMCVLISLSFGSQLDMLPPQIVSRLKWLRLYFLTAPVTLDSIAESIVSTIDQYVSQLDWNFEKREYLVVKKEEDTPKPAPRPVPETKSAIIEGVNSRIKGLFSRFKGDEEKRENYDL